MKRLVSILLALVLILTMLGGCAKQAQKPAVKDSKKTEAVDKQSPEKAEKPDKGAAKNPLGAKSTPGEMYSAYLEMKSAFLERVIDSVSQEAPMSVIGLLGLSTADLMLIPITLIGMDKGAIKAGLAVFGSDSDFQYNISGNNYTLSYKDNGETVLYEMEYNPAKQAAATKLSKGGKELMFFEYIKTSYGYASQHYLVNDDGVFSVYMGTFYGSSEKPDGVVGVSEQLDAAPKSILSGTEPAKDLPKQCKTWFAIEGASGKGQNDDGSTFNFNVG
ncbi:MAG TPA: hypothetical protein PKX46_03685 [Clostridia bacterium]|nr:hypothetical protein [Clostridia bacterium]HOR13005.1 hypothetical protein [Clostridia bacterium]